MTNCKQHPKAGLSTTHCWTRENPDGTVSRKFIDRCAKCGKIVRSHVSTRNPANRESRSSVNLWHWPLLAVIGAALIAYGYFNR